MSVKKESIIMGRAQWMTAHPRILLGVWAVVMLAGVSLLSGCSQIVDPKPDARAPEANVKNYYILLESSKMEYRYDLATQNAFQPLADVLIMDMQGADPTDTYNSIPVWYCNWSYAAAGAGRPWFYALCDTEAVALGIEQNGNYTDSWIELKAPLSNGASWSFTSQGESVTATVTKYGVSAAVNGHTYDDVVVVDYKGAAGTAGTAWFARGTGTIYSHIERPGNQMMDLKFRSKS